MTFQRLAKPSSYRSVVKACILDWSGTTADKYVIAPAVVFVDVFKKFGVPITMEEARFPMGLRKDLHIQALTEMPEIKKRWCQKYGRDPDQSDVDKMFKDFVPMQLECLPKYTGLLPGVVETVDHLRTEHKIKIGSTTGFTRVMVDVLLSHAKQQGYNPDVTVAGDEVINGARPKPFMVYRNLDLLDVYPIQSAVKVDDTISGVGEAVNAGCWGVGVARYSNYMNIDSEEHEATITPIDMEQRLQKSRQMLSEAGAHYVIDSIVELPEVITDINERLSKGDAP